MEYLKLKIDYLKRNNYIDQIEADNIVIRIENISKKLPIYSKRIIKKYIKGSFSTNQYRI